MRRITYLLFIIYILLTIYTLAGIFIGIPYQPIFTPLLTLLAFLIAILHGQQSLGWKHMLLLLGLTFAVSLVFESVGVATGWVYGPYHYTSKLGPKFLGLVPLLIPVAWFMMTYPSYVIASRLTPVTQSTQAWRLLVAGVGALVMTSWDLVMDPMMVAGGHWIWEQPGDYFGVPLQNYWGWWLTTFVTFWLFLALARIRPTAMAPRDRFAHLPIWSYAAMGASNILADFEFSLSGPALVGIFAMLPWVILSLAQPNTPTPQPAQSPNKPAT